MTEPVEPPAPETPEAATAPAADAPPVEPKVTETVDYWKQRARQNEAQAKTNADAAKKLKEIEDRDLSELQRAQKQAAETATQLAELQRRNTLLSKGISEDLTPPAADAPTDEWSAYADKLIAWRGAATPPPTNPRPDPGQGAQPNTQTKEDAEYSQYRSLLFPTNQ